MEERASRMERLYHDLDIFLNCDDDSMTKTIYKKEAERLERYIYESDIPVTIERKPISAEKLMLVIKKN